ncbi:cell division protein [Klebsiella pneumoniae]|uniref:Cell division protein n=1 Tax=Klebsiella pneumoniae TaxID=573 RepID=A0A4P0Y1K4_KLEPN|nr:cell division protein [Klebsiella pneumoniae]
MSQEYTEDKEVKLTKLSSGRRLLEAMLILCSLFAIWLMAALLSFNPSDPSWSQTAWHEPIHNLGGAPGAWLADTLFFIFGVMAYTIPVIIIGGCWFAWRHQENDEYIDYFAVSLRLIGALALILTSCGLAAINADDIWYFASGGVIGSLLSTTLQPLLHSSGGTIALLCIWAAGLTLFTGWSWVSIAEKLGGGILSVLTFASNRTRRDDTWVDEGEYEDDEEEYDDEEAVRPQESRRARILRSALARRKRLAEKFTNPMVVKPTLRFSPANGMDDGEEVVQYSASGAPVAADDVLFSGASAARPAEDDVLFSGASAVRPGDFDPYDPLLNGHSIAEPVSAAAAATAAPQAWQNHRWAITALRQLISRKPAIRRSRPISLNPLRSSRLLISRQRGKPHRRRISLSQRRINSRFTIRVPVNLRRRPISLSQRRISSRLTIRMPVNLRRRPISLSQRRISSRLTIRMPVNLRRRPISLSQRRISSRLTIPMPVNLRRRPISLSQRRISSRLTIPMPVSLRRRPISLSQRRISSRLTIRMPASPRRSRISRSQRRISRKARQFPHRSQSPRSCRRK